MSVHSLHRKARRTPPSSSRRAGGFSLVLRPTTTGAAFGSLAVSLSKKGHLLGHSPHPGGLFWRAAEADGLRAVFPPAHLLLPGGDTASLRRAELKGILL